MGEYLTHLNTEASEEAFYVLGQHHLETRVAEVARARERRSPKSLDSDENFKP